MMSPLYPNPYSVMPQAFAPMPYMNYPYMPSPYPPPMTMNSPLPQNYKENSPGSESKNDSIQVEMLKGELQKLQDEYKALTIKYNILKDKPDNSVSVKKFEELEEKLKDSEKRYEDRIKRKELESKACEEVLRSEVEELKKRNEVLSSI
jgi:hypothetical protein